MTKVSRRTALKIAGALPMFGALSARSAFADGPPLPVSIVASSSAATMTLVELIKRMRFLEEFGVAPKITQVADASRVMPALISNEIDYCTLNGISLLFPAIEKGANLKLLGGCCDKIMTAVYSAKPDVKSLADLKGRTVGTGAIGALQHQIMVAVLKRKGVDPATVTFRNVGSNADIFRAVVAGTVDAGPSTLDVYDQQEKYKMHVLSDGDLWTELPDYPNQGTFASGKAIAEKPEALVRTLAGFGKFYRYLHDPKSYDNFLAAYEAAVGPDRPQAESAWGFIQKIKPYAVDIVMPERIVNFVQQLNVDTGAQKAMMPMDKIADYSLANKALKLLAAA